jgi:hypothetical protein
MGQQRLIELAYDRIVHETSNAKLYDFGDQQAWIPKSCIEWDEGEDGGTVEFPEKMAQDKGLI